MPSRRLRRRRNRRPRSVDAQGYRHGCARPRPPEATSKVDARATSEIIADIQRELMRRGYYDGVVDGRYGARTDAPLRDIEQASGLKASTEPNEALLAAIKRSTTKPAKAPSGCGRQPIQRNGSSRQRRRPEARARGAAGACPSMAMVRSSRPVSSMPKPRPRSRGSSASAGCRSPGSSPTAWPASLPP